jgi:hypothetical protein
VRQIHILCPFLKIFVAGRTIHAAYFGQGVGHIVLDRVRCTGDELRLLNCRRNGLFEFTDNCDHDEDISVRCILRYDQRMKNMTVNVDIINIYTPSTVHTGLISWVLYNTTTDEPNSFDVECFNERHSITMSVSGQVFTTNLTGLLPLTSYNCCVTAVYELYRADGVCDNETETPELFISDTTMLRASEIKNVIVGGVLGFIVLILLVLLIISGAALVLLLLPRCTRKRNAVSAR